MSNDETMTNLKWTKKAQPSNFACVGNSDFAIPSCFVIRASSFLILYHPAPDAPYLRMMGQHMHVSIAAAEKCA